MKNSQSTRRVLAPILEDESPRPPPLPAPAAPRAHDAVIDTLARTLWAVARDQPVRVIEAVAAMVINQVPQARCDAEGGRRAGWGDAVIAVCRETDLLASRDGADHPDPANRPAIRTGDPVFSTCLRIARRAAAGVLADPTGGATRFHRNDSAPSWAIGHAPCVEIGTLVFYEPAPLPHPTQCSPRIIAW